MTSSFSNFDPSKNRITLEFVLKTKINNNRRSKKTNEANRIELVMKKQLVFFILCLPQTHTQQKKEKKNSVAQSDFLFVILIKWKEGKQIISHKCLADKMRQKLEKTTFAIMCCLPMSETVQPLRISNHKSEFDFSLFLWFIIWRKFHEFVFLCCRCCF